MPTCPLPQEAAEQMMGGVKACDLKDMDPEASDQQIRSTCFTSHMLKMRVQEETYNDETKVKVSVTRYLAEQCRCEIHRAHA